MPSDRSESPPTGLRAPYLALWRGCLEALKRQGTWTPDQKPLLDDYVLAVRQSVEHQKVAEADPFTVTEQGRVYAHPGFALADQAAKRAVLLADTLILSPKARRAHGIDGDEEQANPLDRLDELAQRRKAS